MLKRPLLLSVIGEVASALFIKIVAPKDGTSKEYRQNNQGKVPRSTNWSSEWTSSTNGTFFNLFCDCSLRLKNRPEASPLLTCKFPGAGDGNRTRVISLEGWGSTIELRPQEYGRDDRIRTCDILLPKQARYQTAPRPEEPRQPESIDPACPKAFEF